MSLWQKYCTINSKIRAGLWRLSMRMLPRGCHITRYYMYNHLESLAETLPIKEGDVLSISHSSNLADLMKIKVKSLVEANYPEYNILDLDFPDESFDFVFSDQVFEHIEGDPKQAMDECWRVLRKGGIALHTTCFINPIHGAPSDFWRFTPDALRLLGNKFAKVIDCDGWGNFETWLLIRDGLRLDGVPHAKWHPFHRIATRKDPEWPISTWIMLQK